MRNYELTLLVSSGLKEENANKIIEEIGSFIQKEQGATTQAEKPIQKRLAYPINKQKEAYIAVLSFYLEPEKIKNLNPKLKEINEILRFAILAKKPEKKFPASKRRRRVLVKEKSAIEKEIAPSFKSVKEKEGRRQTEKLKEIEEKLDEILGE